MADAIAELIALITDEADRKAAQDLFSKYEPMRGAVLRQSDYDRLMNEGKTKISDAETRAKKWEDWAAVSVPKHDQLMKEWDDVQAENKTLREKVAEAATRATGNGNNGSGTGVDPKEITRQVMAELGGKPASAKEIADMVQSKVQETAATMQKDFFEKTIPQQNEWQSQMLDAQLDYREEFKKPLDRKSFLKFMVDNKIDSPREAMNRFVADDRSKVTIEAEVQKRLTEELSKRNMPGVSGNTSAPDPLGPLQIRLQGKGPVISEGSRPGDGSLAQQAADAMRSEGKF